MGWEKLFTKIVKEKKNQHNNSLYIVIYQQCNYSSPTNLLTDTLLAVQCLTDTQLILDQRPASSQLLTVLQPSMWCYRESNKPLPDLGQLYLLHLPLKTCCYAIMAVTLPYSSLLALATLHVLLSHSSKQKTSVFY